MSNRYIVVIPFAQPKGIAGREGQKLRPEKAAAEAVLVQIRRKTLDSGFEDVLLF